MTDDTRSIKFVNGVLDAIDSAPAKARPEVRAYSFGSDHIEITYRSPQLLERFSPAFAHVRSTAPGEPRVRLTIADSKSVEARLPDLPWATNEYRACGEIPGFVEGALYSHLNLPMSALTVINEETGRAVYWCRKPERLPSYEFAGPLRAFLHRHFVRSRKMPVLHAGAVALDGKAVLIIGDKGAGKTTTTLSCLAAGLGYIGDDKVLVDAAEHTAFSLYSVAKFFMNETEKLPLKGLGTFLHGPLTADDRKALIYVDQFAPRQIVTAARIVAIVHCSIADSTTSSLTPLDPAFAVRKLVSDNIGLFPSTAATTLASVARLCRETPCLRLHAGGDLEEVAGAVAGLLARC